MQIPRAAGFALPYRYLAAHTGLWRPAANQTFCRTRP